MLVVALLQLYLIISTEKVACDLIILIVIAREDRALLILIARSKDIGCVSKTTVVKQTNWTRCGVVISKNVWCPLSIDSTSVSEDVSLTTSKSTVVAKYVHRLGCVVENAAAIVVGRS